VEEEMGERTILLGRDALAERARLERSGYEVIGSTRVGTRTWLRVKEVRHSRREWLLDPTATAIARPTKNALMFRRYVETMGGVYDAHATPFVAATEATDLGEKRYSWHPRSAKCWNI
jgi:hypothetical protein